MPYFLVLSTLKAEKSGRGRESSYLQTMIPPGFKRLADRFSAGCINPLLYGGSKNIISKVVSKLTVEKLPCMTLDTSR